jgi:hypothetical protein
MIQIISKQEPKELLQNINKRELSGIYLKKTPEILSDIVIFMDGYKEAIEAIKNSNKILRAVFIVLHKKLDLNKEEIAILEKKSLKYYLYTTNYDATQEELSNLLNTELYIDENNEVEEEILIDIISLEHN